MARLSILSNDELKALYNLPSLNDEEKTYVFELDNEDRAYIETLNDTAQKINYILQLGYYRTVSYFFRFTFNKLKMMCNLYCITTFQQIAFLKRIFQSIFIIKIDFKFANDSQ